MKIHVLYQIQAVRNTFSALKAETARYSNEGAIKDDLKLDCFMCLLTVLWEIASTAEVKKW